MNFICKIIGHKIDEDILNLRKTEDHPFDEELNNPEHVIGFGEYILYCVRCGQKLSINLHYTMCTRREQTEEIR